MVSISERSTESRARRSPAEIYDELFVPALFRPWGEILADEAAIGPGADVLDVACGTGVAAAAALPRVGDGTVTGLDVSDDMLAVAKRNHPAIEWHHGRAESLPFADAAFDAVVSQFGFMFFEDRPAALREMWRVLRPGGRLAVAVCDAIDHSSGYSVLTELLHRLFGLEAAQAMRAPFSCGDPELLARDCAAADLADARITRHNGTVRFASIHALVSAERACVWTLGGLLDESQFEHLAVAAEESLQPFTNADGEVVFTMPTLIITAMRN